MHYKAIHDIKTRYFWLAMALVAVPLTSMILIIATVSEIEHPVLVALLSVVMSALGLLSILIMSHRELIGWFLYHRLWAKKVPMLSIDSAGEYGLNIVNEYSIILANDYYTSTYACKIIIAFCPKEGFMSEEPLRPYTAQTGWYFHPAFRFYQTNARFVSPIMRRLEKLYLEDLKTLNDLKEL